MKKTTSSEIQSWLENMKQGFDDGACYSPKFLKPFHFLTLATELKRYSEKQLSLPEKLRDYAGHMGLWDAIGLNATVTKNSKGKYLPIEALKSSQKVQDSANKLTDILKPYCIDKIAVDSIHCLLLELIANCFDHADIQHELHGLVCCQPWPKGKLAQIAFVDSGVGIRKTLSGNESLSNRLDGENCCELATQYGVTGKPFGRHSGYGLTLARDLIEQNKGNLIIISESEVFQSIEGKTFRGYADTPWHGTIIVLEINTDRLLNSTEVFRNWPLPTGFTEDDFNFEN